MCGAEHYGVLGAGGIKLQMAISFRTTDHALWIEPALRLHSCIRKKPLREDIVGLPHCLPQPSVQHAYSSVIMAKLLKRLVVWAVHCEPVCSPKTLFLGNLTGELPNFGIFGPFQREYTHPFQALTNQLPDKNNRSLLRLNRSNGQENRSF